jgi:ATP-dependent exoDNAse (exonuclease V) beta subunit
LSKLHIYRASAGSGKTFTISREYIGLLFENPEKYRNILAVTFTNKATAEMKGRILRELYKLASNQKSDYVSFLTEKNQEPESAIREKARYILNLLLHNYSHFTITTIDSFFQKVIRAFAHELGIYSGFEVETDTNTVLNEAVEMLFRKTVTDEKLRKWLVRFAENKIEEERSWDLRDDIINLGREIHKEIFKQIDSSYFSEIINRDTIEAIIPSLKQYGHEFESHLKQIAVQGKPIMQKYGLVPDDFTRKASGFISIFDKMSTGRSFEVTKTAREAVDNVTVWYAKTSPKKHSIEEAFYNGLNSLIKELVTYSDAHIQAYNTIDLIFKNIYVLGIIADLIQEINDYVADKNLFLLADSTAFLQKIVEGSDAPFIYEKTGSRITHFMIDEFQDTSGMQWESFKPLIENSLAGNYRNWVVGDVKQSIYRWRNSDWTILSDKIFQQFPESSLKVHSLEDNWRSSENVISFNNTFFTCLRDKLQEDLNDSISKNALLGSKLEGFSSFFTKAYSDCVQRVPEKHRDGKGYVRLEYLEKENWEETALKKLVETVEHLQLNGYKLKDIAILVREKRSGVDITNYFMQEKVNRPGNFRYDIISSDALFLKNAPVVQWIVSLLRFLLEPADELNKAFVVNEFKDYLTVTDNEEFSFELRLSAFLENSPKLKAVPVYELVDIIITQFALSDNKSNMPYLQSFQDAILQYGKKNTIDLASFLIWWDDFSDKQVISMPENQDAIRLMTIHASKGLEFKVVLIPFGDWEFAPRSQNSFIWTVPHEQPFDQFKLLPVQLGSSTSKSIFGYEYFLEQIYTKIDNLNLLYVAFTRAIDKLIVFTPKAEIKDELKSTSHLLALFRNGIAFRTENYLDNSMLTIDEKEETSLMEYGVDSPFTGVRHEEENDIQLDKYTTSSISARKAKMVVSGEFRTLSSIGNNLRVKGNIFHEMFQNIKTVHDIDTAAHEMVAKGLVAATEEKSLISEVSALLENPDVTPWFTSEWKVKAEADILLRTGQLKRPDRIMFGKNRVIVVDYKFGEKEEQSHINQVLNYKYKLQQMGHRNVEAYVWYVFLKKVKMASDKPVQGKLF